MDFLVDGNIKKPTYVKTLSAKPYLIKPTDVTKLL